MFAETFFDTNTIRVNKIIARMFIFSNLVGPLLMLGHLAGVFVVTYKYCLMIMGVTAIATVLMNVFVRLKIKPQTVKYMSLILLICLITVIGCASHVGIYILLGLAPFVSCLYMDTRFTFKVNFFSFIGIIPIVFVRALESAVEYPEVYPDIWAYVLPYGTGYVIELFFVGLVSCAISKLFRTTIERDRKKDNTILTMQQNYITSFANMVECHERFTGLHIKRTAIFVELIARQMVKRGDYVEELTESQIDFLIKAAALHDIGKISVRDEILMKPGKYTPEEYEQMKVHCEEGCRLIRENLCGVESDDFLNIAQDVALCHHERWDGSGYPHGIKNRKIPLCARIMAVADVTDALLSKRLYKDAFGFEESMKILEDGKGSQFEPCIVDALLDIKEKVREVHQKYHEKI